MFKYDLALLEKAIREVQPQRASCHFQLSVSSTSYEENEAGRTTRWSLKTLLLSAAGRKGFLAELLPERKKWFMEEGEAKKRTCLYKTTVKMNLHTLQKSVKICPSGSLCQLSSFWKPNTALRLDYWKINWYLRPLNDLKKRNNKISGSDASSQSFFSLLV